MNFISHYFLDGYKGKIYYNLGLILPDLLAIYKRSWKLNNSEVKIVKKPDLLNNIREGCERHKLVDRFFHNSDFFKYNCYRIKQLFLQNNLNSPPYRLFFIAHVLLELIMDKIIIKQNSTIIDNFYKDLESIDINMLNKFLIIEGFSPNDDFIIFYQNFVTNKYLYEYKDIHFILHVLNRILSRAKTRQIREDDYKKFLKCAIQAENLLTKNFMDSFKELKRYLN